jgi:hypothetical protein
LYVDVRDFGARGDGEADDVRAIEAALASLAGNSPMQARGDDYFLPSATLYFPPGRYRLSRTLSLKQQVRLLGDTSGIGRGSASMLVFPPNVTGILVNRHNTAAQEGIVAPTTSAEGSVIEGLAVAVSGPGATRGNPATGIYARGRCRLVNCEATGFARDGFAFVGNESGDQHLGNVNTSVVRDCSAQHNSRHGLWIAGDNANACLIENLNSEFNGGYGFCDETVIGQTWIGGHSASNGKLMSGQFRTTSMVWHRGRIYALLPGTDSPAIGARTPPDAGSPVWSLREENVPEPFFDIPEWRPGMALIAGGAGYIGAGRHVHVNPYTEGRQGPYVNNGAIALGGSPGAGFVGRGINVYPSEGRLNAIGHSEQDMAQALDRAWAHLRRAGIA